MTLEPLPQFEAQRWSFPIDAVGRIDMTPDAETPTDADPQLRLADQARQRGQSRPSTRLRGVLRGKGLPSIIRQMQKAQHAPVLAVRIALQIVEQDHQHAVGGNAGQQPVELRAEPTDLAVDQLALRLALLGNAAARLSCLLQIPGGCEIVNVLVAGEDQLFMQ